MPGTSSRFHGQSLQPWIALLTAIAFSFTLMAVSDMKGTEIARERTCDILSVLARPFGIFPAILHLSSENARLRAENAALNIESTAAQEALLENERLRNLLDFRSKSKLNLRSAEVIATNPISGVRSLLLDIGTKQGAVKHTAVISDLGLVGKLVQTSEQTSVAQTLLDRNLGAAVRLSICRVNGITSWTGGNRLIVENIPASASVRLDEEVITSGLDGIFPEGIIVGKVVSTKKAPESLFLKVEVAPAVNFARLEEVFIVYPDSSGILQP